MAIQPEGFSPATILDVARRAGVSRTTVSRVLNRPESVSRETLARVQQASAELNYVPSNAARSLRSGRTGTIALIVNDISLPFHGALARSVAHAAGIRGLNLALCDVGHGEDQPVELLTRLAMQSVDGIILATGDDVTSGPVHDAVSGVTARGVAIVITVGDPGDSGVWAVDADYERTAAEATQHLIDRGARDIVMLGGDASHHSAALASGYRSALTGLPDARPSVAHGQYSYDESVRVVSELLTNDRPVDGIVAGTIPMALGAIRALETHGRRVPQDVALVACEEVPLARHVRPQISTVAMDLSRLGDEAVRLLSVVMSGGQPEPNPIQPVWSIRET